MIAVNIRNLTSYPNPKICAFCKFWNDRQDTHIQHKCGDLWECDTSAREYCSQKRMDTPSTLCCPKFEMKM